MSECRFLGTHLGRFSRKSRATDTLPKIGHRFDESKKNSSRFVLHVTDREKHTGWGLHISWHTNGAKPGRRIQNFRRC